jgi:quinoprotein glucose dehydrogenase
MGMALDRENEIVYVPTGSASFDFYGADRHGANLYANCLLALNASTGKRIWHFQVVHHDIWDRDLPAPPNLLTLEMNGKKTEAVAQITKHGYVFLFDRLTGKPVFDIEEKSVPASDMPGEQAFPTQPFPTKPAPFTRQSFTTADLRKDIAGREEITKLVKDSRTGQPFIPITKQRTVLFPGSDGGAQWGGAAIDNQQIMYIPAKEIPVYTSLREVDVSSNVGSGEKIYQQLCSSCHGKDRNGDHSGSYPGLRDISQRATAAGIEQLLLKGRGMMPAFAHIPHRDREAVISFLLGRKEPSIKQSDSTRIKYPYTNSGYNRWYDSAGYPINTPPWGTLTAIDLKTGNRLWQVPLGEYPALTKKGKPSTGTDNYGGPLVTASGIIFIAATPDKKFKAIDKKTGRTIWETALPAAGYASPSTYAVNGKQYVVIACGGGKLKSNSGGKYVAFALKDKIN